MIRQIPWHDLPPVSVRELAISVEFLQHTHVPPLDNVLPVDAIVPHPQRIHAGGGASHYVRLQRITDHYGTFPHLLVLVIAIVAAGREGDVIHLPKGFANPFDKLPRHLLRHALIAVRRPHEPLVRVADRSGHGGQTLVGTDLVGIAHQHGKLIARRACHGPFHDLPVLRLVLGFGNYGRSAIVYRERSTCHDEVRLLDGRERPSRRGDVRLVVVAAAEYVCVSVVPCYEFREDVPISTSQGLGVVLEERVGDVSGGDDVFEIRGVESDC
mmetsp:Transcript_19319/g.46359  ORF Transcript_19319/g.46359 Transcript_19319/m.46359 type:complete len:270 (+) Transcript_19319:261-1070(+)